MEERINTSSGTTVKTYAYGSDLISQSTIAPGATLPVLRYFSYDGLGSVRELTNETGTTTDSYDYDAFGILVYSSTSNLNSSYLYRGERFEQDVGQYYLRARFYNPGTGRFWNQDAFEGFPDQPDSLNKYLYAYGNPVSHFDPSGLNPTIPGLQAINTVVAFLARLAIPIARAALGRALWGGLIGGFIGGVDSYLAGQGFWTGAGRGAIAGAIVGAISIIRPLLPILTAVGAIGGVGGTIQAFGSGNVKLGIFRAAITALTLGLPILSRNSNAPSPMMTKYFRGSGGRWGNRDTRSLNNFLAMIVESLGGKVKNGAGRASEERFAGPGGGTKGGTWVDITVELGGYKIRIQTVDTLADGATLTAEEAAAAGRILANAPGDILILFAKSP